MKRKKAEIKSYKDKDKDTKKKDTLKVSLIPVSCCKKWSHPWDSNPRPFDYESNALSAELGWQIFCRITKYTFLMSFVSSNAGG